MESCVESLLLNLMLLNLEVLVMERKGVLMLLLLVHEIVETSVQGGVGRVRGEEMGPYIKLPFKVWQ